MADIKFEIKEQIGVLSTNDKGWSKEFNLVSWNDRDAKYEIRDWSSDHTKMSKGITMTKEEILALKNVLDELCTKL